MTNLAHFANAHPDKAAIILGEESLTYGRLEKLSLDVAHLFAAHGAKGGSVVAMLAQNQVEAFVVAWAAQRSGLYLAPIGTKLTASEIAYILDDCRAEIVVCSPKLATLTANAISLQTHKCATQNVFVMSWEGGQFASLFAPQIPLSSAAHSPCAACEGGDMLYTSGTTGRPKGVKRPLSGKTFGTDTSRADRSRDLFAMNSETVFLSPAPLYHAAPLRFAMSVHRLGGTVILMERFEPFEAWALLHKHGVTHSQWAPTMFNRLLAARDNLIPTSLPPAHRVTIHAGAPCSVAVKHEMIAWWGPILYEYYSGTESIGFTHIRSDAWLKKPGSVGQAVGCKIHIVNPQSGESLPQGQIGSVYFEGKAPLIYHNSADKTASATHANGWATMGDIGYLDSDGYLFLTDRAAFTIISGGVNIYPKEVEDALLAQSIITDAAVFGVPDPDLGEAVVAAVTLKQGFGASAKTASDIGLALRAKLSSIKIPKRIIFCDELPRSDAGKLLKRVLQDEFATWGASRSYPTQETLAA